MGKDNRTTFEATGFEAGLRMTVSEIRKAISEIRQSANADMREFRVGLEEALVARS